MPEIFDGDARVVYYKRRHRKFYSGFYINLRELRYDKSHYKKHDGYAERQEYHRIEKSLLRLLLYLLMALKEHGIPHQNTVQLSARLSGLHHIYEEPGEYFVVYRKRLRKRAPALDLPCNVTDNVS